MLIKNIHILLFIIILWFYLPTNSYKDELAYLDKWKTIKELKQNIDKLDKVTIDLDNELKELNTNYELKSFLRSDLNIVDIKKIKKIASNYNINKVNIEDNLLLKADKFESILSERKLLLEEKRKFYSWLIPYIDSRYKFEYLDYIKKDAKIFNEQNNVTNNIILKKEILTTKVENIESRIKKHNDFINNSIRSIIETRLDEKIFNLRKNPRFKNLSYTSKIKVLEKTITKIKSKLILLKNTTTHTDSLIKPSINILNKKIETFNIAVDKLEKFKKSLK